jgi:hypothetical protein
MAASMISAPSTFPIRDPRCIPEFTISIVPPMKLIGSSASWSRFFVLTRISFVFDALKFSRYSAAYWEQMPS